MKLQKKIILVMFLVIAVVLVGQLFVSDYITNTQLANMEKERAIGHLSKTHFIIKRELEHLGLLADAWAELGGCTFELMHQTKTSEKGMMPVEEDFLSINKLNLLLFYNKDGMLFSGQSVDLENGKYLNLEQNFAEVLPRDHILLNHGVNKRKVLGIYLVDSQPMLIASAPVTDTFQRGRDSFVIGTIIIGRFLNSNLLPAFKKTVDVRWEVMNVDDFVRNFNDLDLGIEEFPIKKPIVNSSEDDQNFYIYDSHPALNDPRGVVLRLTIQGGALRAASEKLSYMINISIAFGLVAFVIFAIFFNNIVILPIKSLTSQVQGIRMKSFANLKLDISRKDEFGILAVEFDKLLLQLNKRSEEIALIGSLDNLLAACSTTEEAGEVFKRISEKLLIKCSGALAVINASGNLFEVKTSWGGEWIGEHVYSPDDCWALRRGQVHSMSETASSPVCRHMSEGLPKPTICIPLVAQGDTLGVLHVMTKSEFKESEIQLAENLAKHTSLALANLRLREALHVQAIRDPLTGLYNRRYLEESIERELSRAKRENKTIGVFMMDLDHFKRFNDDFGHEAGDYVLKQLGLVLKNFVRNEDIACRYGGEEFTVILPGADLDTCKERGEILCDTIRKMDMRFREKELGIVTLSIGLAVSPEHGDSGAGILAAADRALYRAKANGRDRVEVAS